MKFIFFVTFLSQVSPWYLPTFRDRRGALTALPGENSVMYKRVGTRIGQLPYGLFQPGKRFDAERESFEKRAEFSKRKRHGQSLWLLPGVQYFPEVQYSPEQPNI